MSPFPVVDGWFAGEPGRNRAHSCGTPASAWSPGRRDGTAGLYPPKRSDRRLRRTRSSERGARSSGSAEVTSTSPPVTGCLNRRRCACRNWRSSPRSPLDTVQGIARYGKVDRGQVDPDLVCPPRLQRDVEERMLRRRLHDLEVGHGLAGLVGVERTPRRVAARAADRSVDPTRARARMPSHQRQVSALDLTTTNGIPKSRIRRSDRVATRSPDVSRSRRWTMPGRSGSSPPRAPRVRSCAASVPAPLPAPGCTVSPAGLSTTTRCSSSRSTRT